MLGTRAGVSPEPRVRCQKHKAGGVGSCLPAHLPVPGGAVEKWSQVPPAAPRCLNVTEVTLPRGLVCPAEDQSEEDLSLRVLSGMAQMDGVPSQAWERVPVACSLPLAPRAVPARHAGEVAGRVGVVPAAERLVVQVLPASS